MSWFTPSSSTPPDLSPCQKYQCGLLQSLSADEVKACIEAGYDLSEVMSPLNEACRQYFPTRCQVGPSRWFPDWETAFPNPGPLIQYDLPLRSAMGPQAANMPSPPASFASIGVNDSFGAPVPAIGAPLYDGWAPGDVAWGSKPRFIPNAAPGLPSSTTATVPGGSAQSPSTVPVTLVPDDMPIGVLDTSGSRMNFAPDYGAFEQPGSYPYFENPTYHRYNRTRTPMEPITLSRPLPSITPLTNKNMSAYGYVDTAGVMQSHDDSGCSGVGEWINKHKGWAVAGLAAVVIVATRRKR